MVHKTADLYAVVDESTFQMVVEKNRGSFCVKYEMEVNGYSSKPVQGFIQRLLQPADLRKFWSWIGREVVEIDVERKIYIG